MEPRCDYKRVYRAYCALWLNQLRRTKKEPSKRDALPLAPPACLNDTWAMDYRGNSLYSGRAFSLCKILGEGTGEALAIEADLSLPSVGVIAVLEQLCTLFGRTRLLCCADSSNFLEGAMTAWALQHGIYIQYIEFGEPNQVSAGVPMKRNKGGGRPSITHYGNEGHHQLPPSFAISIKDSP